MSFLDWFLGILLFILALGVLVIIHELGHLATAKMFNVYCMEFSVGFGPKIFSHRGKGKETKFSLRWIPIGGYVSMYGEGAELEDGLVIPENRGLQAIAKWKQAIIYAAGIFLNFILGFVLIFVSNSCFPHTQVTSALNISESSIAASSGIKSDDKMFLIGTQSGNNYYYIIDDKASIVRSDGTTSEYVMVCNPTYITTKDPVFNDCLYFFHQGETKTYKLNNVEISYFIPDYSQDSFSVSENCTFSANISTIVYGDVDDEGNKLSDDVVTPHAVTVQSSLKEGTESTYIWNDMGISFQRISRWYGIGEDFSLSWDQFAYANTAVIKAVGGLFTGSSWSNVGGPIAIAGQITMVNANYGFGMYVYYAGFLSVNLALLNLFPFPGLDGWSLVVVAFEAIFRKKVSTKAKAIMSYIGLGILLILAILIAVKDIIALF